MAARIVRAAALAAALGAPGCEAEDPEDARDLSYLEGDIQGIADWLADGEYAGWETDSRIRDRDEAGGARVYLSPPMIDSLEAGLPSHPVGAAAVRELYETDLRTLKGFAVTIKVEPGPGPSAWFWYETFDPEVLTEPLIAERGAPGCIGCHTEGVDFIQSQVPLP